MEAFDLAREEGFAWIEFDVWPSADGLPVIMHDATLDRTAEATGPISEKLASELEKIPLKGADSVRRWRVPVGLPHNRGAMLVEVKPFDARDLVVRIVESVESHETPWMLQSFDSKNLLHAWEIDPAITAAWLVESHSELEQAIDERWPVVHARHDLLDESSVAAMRNAGISIGAWTVNEEEDVRRMVLLRPDRIITDAPRRVRRMIEELESFGVREHFSLSRYSGGGPGWGFNRIAQPPP